MASWSDAKINMMDEKAEEDMKVLIGLSMEVVLDAEMMKADKEVDREVDEMLFQFAFLLYDTSEHHLAAHCQLLVLAKVPCWSDLQIILSLATT